MFHHLIVVCGLALLGGLANAQPLKTVSMQDVLELAATSEPGFMATKVAVDAASARLDQQRASRWPSVTMTGNTTRNDRDYKDKPEELANNKSRYNARQLQLQVTQPIIKPTLGLAIDQAQSVVEQASAQTAAALNELLIKVVQLWFEFGAAGEALAAGQAQLALHEWQITQLTVAVERGVASTVLLEEARAKAQMAKADMMAAKNEQLTKLRSLEQMTGLVLSTLQAPTSARAGSAEPARGVIWASLRGAIPSCSLQEIDLSNASLRAARANLRAAQREVTKQQRMYAPTLEFVASASHNRQAVGSVPSQPGYQQNNTSYGLQLNWPLSGGMGTFSAKAREAAATLQKAQYELEATVRQARLALDAGQLALATALAKAEAAQAQQRAAKTALAVDERGLALGLKSPEDRLSSQFKLASAIRDERRAQWDHLVQQLKVAALCHDLTPDHVAGWLSSVLESDTALGTKG